MATRKEIKAQIQALKAAPGVAEALAACKEKSTQVKALKEGGDKAAFKAARTELKALREKVPAELRDLRKQMKALKSADDSDDSDDSDDDEE